MMDVRLLPAPLRGAVTPPPSKSLLHRQLICLAQAGEFPCPPDPSDDVEATVRGLWALYHEKAPVIDCGASGSTLRFLLPLAMEFRVLAIGDVTSEEGTAHLRRHLPGFKKMKGVDFTVINGENISGTGLTPQQADDLFAAGADVITLGNHTWGKMQITDYLEDNRYILRPANFSPRTPGRGCGVYDLGRVQVAVLCLIGRCDLAWGSDNPFTTADRLLKAGEKPTFTLVDFHAQATSEKLAMAYYLDGRVSALWGTHTHVPTADERVFPKGTGYITDLGMTGAVESVLGIRPEQSVESFLGGLPGRYRPAEGPCKAQGALFTLESSTGLCTAVERVEIR